MTLRLLILAENVYEFSEKRLGADNPSSFVVTSFQLSIYARRYSFPLE